MIPKMRFGWARLPMLVAGVSLASMLAAAAGSGSAERWAQASERVRRSEAALAGAIAAAG